VHAGNRVQEIEAVVVAEDVQRLDRQRVLFAVGNQRRETVFDRGLAAGEDVAEVEAAVLIVGKIDP